MTNQEQYELICEKAKKYDRLVRVITEIKAEIEQGYCKVENDYDRGRNMGLYIATQIIDDIMQRNTQNE